MEKDKFIVDISHKIIENKVIIFLGSGINKESGLPDWNELLDDLYDDLNINHDPKNHIDHIDLAQYFTNLNGGRNELIDKIKKKINLVDAKPGLNLLEIAKLPVKEYWTTNYDNLLEEAFTILNKKHKKIITKSNFAFQDPNNINIYKMHGDIESEDKIVITRRDYDKYEQNNNFFWSKLALDLSHKSCIFIGTSLNDFNLNIILSKVSLLVDSEQTAPHYIFFLKETDEELIKLQEYKTKELLERFKIKSILLDNWSELKLIFEQINNNVTKNNIFVSGAAYEYDNCFLSSECQNDITDNAKEFISELCYGLVKSDKKIFTGYGLGIGDSIIGGSLTAIYEDNKNPNLLEVYPFPQNIKDKIKQKEIWEKNRNYMISNSSTLIILFGNKKDKNSNKVVISSGIIDGEFRIGKTMNKKIIPVGSTGYAAMAIWKEINEHIEEYPYLKKYIETLKTERDPKEIIKIINEINSISIERRE